MKIKKIIDGKEVEVEVEEGQEQVLDDDEIAVLAAKKLREKDDEIKKLKRDLAKEKLLSTPQEEVAEIRSKEELLKVITDPNVSNYDYAQAVVELHESEIENGNQSPLGRNGQEVSDFFKEVIEDCDGDKSRFPAVYQAKLGADDPKVAMAYKARKH